MPEIRAGGCWVFPRGWEGTAEVVETLRKVYPVVAKYHFATIATGPGPGTRGIYYASRRSMRASSSGGT